MVIYVHNPLLLMLKIYIIYADRSLLDFRVCDQAEV